MSRFTKGLFFALGLLCVLIGLLGIVVPVLPTTPLLLLAAFFFTRSSGRALQWLLHNRWLGPYIRRYREGRGIAARDKAITLTLLWLTIGLTALLALQNTWIRLLLLLIASGVTIHLLRVKTYHPTEPTPPTLPENNPLPEDNE